MTLRLEEIKKITFGALSIKEEDGAFRFDRFSEEQKAVYEIENQEFKRRCDGTASVMLDFITDSENFSFSFSTESKAGPLINYAFVDVWVDGMMVSHVGDYTIEPNKRDVAVSLPKGEKRVTVYLPSMFKTTLSNVTLDDGATLLPAEKR